MLPESMLAATYVTLPSLEVRELAGQKSVHNELLGTKVDVTPELLAVLDRFRSPKPLGKVLAESSLSPDDVLTAVFNAFIMEVDLLVANVRQSVGPALKMSQLLERGQGPAFAVFGSTVDASATGRAGARHGPAEIRAYCHTPHGDDGGGMGNPFQVEMGEGEKVLLSFDERRCYTGDAPEIVDLGDLRYLPGESMASYGGRLRWVVGSLLEQGTVPVMLGGDHSSTCWALEAVAAKFPAFGIVHFDAHHDLFRPFAPTLSYVTHANPFERVLESGGLKAMHQVGLRLMESIYRSKLKPDPRLSYTSSRELKRLSPAAVFERLPKDLPYYVTFDVDCLDPLGASDTGTPEPGGIDRYTALDLIDVLARSRKVIGFDIMEVSQREGRENHAARTAARIVEQLFLSRMAFEPLGDYQRDA